MKNLKLSLVEALLAILLVVILLFFSIRSSCSMSERPAGVKTGHRAVEVSPRMKVALARLQGGIPDDSAVFETTNTTRLLPEALKAQADGTVLSPEDEELTASNIIARLMRLGITNAADWARGLKIIRADGSEYTLNGDGPEPARKEDAAPERTWADYFREALETGTPYEFLNRKIFQQMGEQDVLESLAALAEIPWGPQANRLLTDILRRWSEINPEAAANYVMDINSRRARGSSLNTVIRAWSATDPDAALRWCLNNGDLDSRAMRSTIGTLFAEMAEQDVQWAWREVWRLDDSALRSSALRSVVNEMTGLGMENELMAALNSLSRTEDRDLLIASMVASWTQYYPEQAAAWVERISDPKERRSAMNRLIYSWGYDQPEQAAAWAAGLTDPAERGLYMGRVISVWAADDAGEAANWLSSFPPEEALDPAIRSMAAAVMEEDFAWSLSWAELISSANSRNSMIRRIITEWSVEDSGAAERYVQSAGYDEALREQLLALIQQQQQP